MNVLFATPRFDVRPYAEGDGTDAFAIYGDPEVWRYLGNGTHSPDPDAATTERALLRTTQRFAERGDGLGLWAVVDREAGRIVATVGLSPMPDGVVELAYHVGRADWGRGVATEAGGAAMRYGFDVLGLPSLVAFVHPPNVASIRVLDKLGFVADGTADYEGAPLLRYLRVAGEGSGRSITSDR